MTFKEYINNPTQTNVMNAAREMYRNMYIEKYNALMVREKGNFEYTLYKGKGKSYIYIKIPSEVVPKFYYDVVIEFTIGNLTKSLLDCEFRVFSNDPSFVFTYAYAFNKNKLFLTDLSNRMGKQPLKEKADVKNPKDEIGYVKSIYFAYLIMQQKGLFVQGKYLTVPTINFKELEKLITPADEKIASRQKEGDSLKKKKKTSEKKETVRQPADNFVKSNNLVNKVATVGKVKTVGKVGGIKKTKRI